MRNIYLIFRRDYLGYVSAWGFWLGLLALPMLAGLGMVFAAVASNATPTRYYAVVEQGSVYADAIEDEFRRARDKQRDEMIQQAEIMNLPIDREELENAPQRDKKFILIDPPANDIDGLRPYLLGEKQVDGPAGPKPLFAVFIETQTEKGRALEYWSEDVNVSVLRNIAIEAAFRLRQNEALAEQGLTEDFVIKIKETAPRVLEKRIRSVSEQVSGGNAVSASDRAPTAVAIGLAYILWLMIFSVIQYLLMGTIEERGNKIFDTLLTSVKLPQLLAGKLLAVLAVTATMAGTWSLTSIVGSAFVVNAVPGAGEFITPYLSAIADPKLIIPALISFVLGYLMYGVIFMAMGSLCDTIQEAQTLLSPMMILLMLPMLAIIVAFNDPSSPLIDGASWIPIFTPFLLILRMPQDPPLWEVLAKMSLMSVTTFMAMWLATKVYRAGAVNGAGIGDVGGWFKGLFGGKKKVAADVDV